jgi:hypothetical protein
MGKLRDALLRELEEDNQKDVERLVAEDAPDKPFGGAFARACAESKADVVATQLREARDQLKDNPGCIETASGQAAFRRAYSSVPGDRLSALFREYGK